MEDLEKQITEDLAIDDSKIDTELRRQPGRYFYYGTLASRATAKTRATKAYLDSLKAQKAKDFKDKMAKEDPKLRITERLLDDYLDLDKDVQATKDGLINDQHKEELFQVALDAFRQKHYALVELMKSKESERIMQSEFTAMKREYEKHEAKKRQQ